MNSYKEYEYTKLTFGKYKGWFMKDIPVDYIIWAVSNIEDLARAEMFKVELLRRRPKWRKIKA
jgi:uncharacterized protein (DUF3820 family)